MMINLQKNIQQYRFKNLWGYELWANELWEDEMWELVLWAHE